MIVSRIYCNNVLLLHRADENKVRIYNSKLLSSDITGEISVNSTPDTDSINNNMFLYSLFENRYIIIMLFSKYEDLLKS